jgi:hypothetical protein
MVYVHDKQITAASNDRIFNRSARSFQSWKGGFFREATLQSNRMKQDLCSPFLSLVALYR